MSAKDRKDVEKKRLLVIDLSFEDETKQAFIAPRKPQPAGGITSCP